MENILQYKIQCDLIQYFSIMQISEEQTWGYMCNFCFTISCSQEFNFITSAIDIAIFFLLAFQTALRKRQEIKSQAL